MELRKERDEDGSFDETRKVENETFRSDEGNDNSSILD